MKRRHIQFLFALPVLCFSVQSLAIAATFYVDNSGSPACSNSAAGGSQTAPWCTVNYAAGRAAPGDTVYVKNGTYNEQVLINEKQGGTGYITFQNYPGHTPILRGSGVQTGRHKIAGSSYIKFGGFTLTNIQQGLFVESSTQIILQNLTVHTVGQEAVHIKDNSSFITLQNSRIHDTRVWQYNGEGVYVGTSTSDQPANPPFDNTNNILIRNNTIYNTNDECIETKPGTYAVTIEGNTMYNCLLDPGITATNWGSIDIMSPGRFYGSNPNHVFRNNTVFANKTAVGLHTGATVSNNVIYGPTGSYRGILVDNPDGTPYPRYLYHNTVDLPASRAITTSGGAVADIRNNIGPSSASNIATSGSFYVNQAGANYHLVPGSAPVNAGVDLTAIVPLDIEGNSRLASRPPDLGAYEFGGAAADTTPPSTPTGLSAAALSASAISLIWTASTDNVGVAGYRVYRGGSQIGTSTSTSYSDTGLTAATSYTYTVSAFDPAGNVSSPSAPGQAATNASGTVTAVSCSQANVQTAINSARDGDAVIVPAGTCIWSSTVTISGKGITLRGAGIDQTVIRDATARYMLSITANPAYSVARVTGFTFDVNGTSKTDGYSTLAVTGSGAGGRFRIDTFKMLRLRDRGIMALMEGTQLSGVIDSCTIEAPFSGSAHGVHVEGAGPQESTQFNYTLALGTANAVYVEDCTFNYSSPNDGALDAYTGARYVFRHNTVNGTTIGHHGADSGEGRGVQGFEMYGNRFNSAGHNVSRIYYMRSGVGFVFDNTATGDFSEGININNYRSCGTFPVWGFCNGSSNWDRNEPGKEGYPCLDQVGHLFTASQGGANVLRPLYAWNNTLNGNTVHATAEGIGNSCTRFLTLHMLENRDFYNQAVNFNGTVGVGRGTQASRPTTCTPLTAYFATDTKTLYQCSSANVWIAYYTPYTYPHPLRGGAPPAPPTNLSVVVR